MHPINWYICVLEPTGLQWWADNVLKKPVTCGSGCCTGCGASGVPVLRGSFKHHGGLEWCAKCWHEYILNVSPESLHMQLQMQQCSNTVEPKMQPNSTAEPTAPQAPADSGAPPPGGPQS